MSQWGQFTGKTVSTSIGTVPIYTNPNVPPGKMYVLNTGNIATANTTGTFTMLPVRRKKAASWGATEAEQG